MDDIPHNFFSCERILVEVIQFACECTETIGKKSDVRSYRGVHNRCAHECEGNQSSRDHFVHRNYTVFPNCVESEWRSGKLFVAFNGGECSRHLLT